MLFLDISISQTNAKFTLGQFTSGPIFQSNFCQNSQCNCMSQKNDPIELEGCICGILEVETRCDSLASCIVPSSVEGMTDPCPLTEKYLEAHYLCHSPIHGPYTTGSGEIDKSLEGSKMPLPLRPFDYREHDHDKQHRASSATLVDHQASCVLLSGFAGPRHTSKGPFHCVSGYNSQVAF